MNVRVVHAPRNGKMYYFPQYETEDYEGCLNPFTLFVKKVKYWSNYVIPTGTGTVYFDTEAEAVDWITVQSTPKTVVWTAQVN